MPKVQLYGPPKVATRPLPGARITQAPSPDAFGAQVGETIARIGDRGFGMIEGERRRVAEKARSDADDLAVQSAAKQLDDDEFNLVWHPDTGLMQRQGKDAFGLPEEFDAKFNEKADTIAGTLTTPEQKLRFGSYRHSRYNSVRHSISEKTAGAIAQWEKADTEGWIATSEQLAFAKTAAMKGLTNPTALQTLTLGVSEHIQNAIHAIEEFGNRHGLPPAQIEEQKLTTYTRFHEGIIAQLLANESPQAAQVWFEEAKAAGQLSGESLEKLTKALAEGDLYNQAQQQADKIRVAGGTRKERMAEVYKITEGEGGKDKRKLRDEVEKRVLHDLDVEEANDRDKQRTLMINAANIVDKKGLRGVMQEPGMWQSMDVGEREAIEHYADRKNKGGVANDDVEYYRLKRLSVEDPEEFMKQVLPKLIHRLDRSHLDHLTDIQDKMIAGDAVAADKLNDDYRTETQVIAQVLKGTGIDPSDKKYDAKIAWLQSEVARQSIDKQKTSKHKVTPSEVEEIVKDILSVQVPDRFYFSVGKQDLLKVGREDITDAEWLSLKASWLKKGVSNPSEAQMLQAYIEAKLQLDRERKAVEAKQPKAAPKPTGTAAPSTVRPSDTTGW